MSAPTVTPTVHRIIAYIAAHPGATSAPIANALGLTQRDVGRRLADAMKRGLLTRTGEGCSGFAYQVTPTGRARAEGVAAPAAMSAADALDLPGRAADLVRAEPWSTTAELAAELAVDSARAQQALLTAARRGQIVGETRMHRGRIVKVWRAVGLRSVPSIGATT